MPVPDPDDLLADLDPAQREAVTITSGPLCILAGAGSGKTRVISRRVAYALASGVVRPRDVLVVTFTDKAAGEMRGRLAALGPPGRRGVDVPCRRAPPAPAFLAARPRDGSTGHPRIQGADPRPAGQGPARRLSLPRGSGPRGGDRMGQGPPDRAGRVRAPGDRRGPRRVAPAGPDGRPVPTLRGGQGSGRSDRLRGHARADDRIDRRGRGDRGRGPRPLPLVLGRRVPGHQSAPGSAPRGVARRARRPRRRR